MGDFAEFRCFISHPWMHSDENTINKGLFDIRLCQLHPIFIVLNRVTGNEYFRTMIEFPRFLLSHQIIQKREIPQFNGELRCHSTNCSSELLCIRFGAQWIGKMHFHFSLSRHEWVRNWMSDGLATGNVQIRFYGHFFFFIYSTEISTGSVIF